MQATAAWRSRRWSISDCGRQFVGRGDGFALSVPANPANCLRQSAGWAQPTPSSVMPRMTTRRWATSWVRTRWVPPRAAKTA